MLPVCVATESEGEREGARGEYNARALGACACRPKIADRNLVCRASSLVTRSLLECDHQWTRSRCMARLACDFSSLACVEAGSVSRSAFRPVCVCSFTAAVWTPELKAAKFTQKKYRRIERFLIPLRLCCPITTFRRTPAIRDSLPAGPGRVQKSLEFLKKFQRVWKFSKGWRPFYSLTAAFHAELNARKVLANCENCASNH